MGNVSSKADLTETVLPGCKKDDDLVEDELCRQELHQHSPEHRKRKLDTDSTNNFLQPFPKKPCKV